MTDAEDRSGDEGSAEPTFMELLDWVEGRPSGDQSIESAIEAGDAETLATIDWIRGFLRFSAKNPLTPVPPAVRQRLDLAFDRHHGRSADVVKQRATLSFDSRTDALLTGVRGSAGVGARYRLAYATDTFGVLMDVTPDGEGLVEFDGQVLSGEGQTAVWEVMAHHRAGISTNIHGKSDGCFSIADVPDDCSHLVLSNGLVEIELPDPLGSSGK